MDLFENRIVSLNDRPVDGGGSCVVYWMQRSQRAFDNPALEFAIQTANELGKSVVVYFGLFGRYPMASQRVMRFMIEGLKETHSGLAEQGFGFVVRQEVPAEGIVRVAREFGACAVVVDEDYLNVGRSWREAAARTLDVAFYQVDAETVVPARNMDREEWGAYTLRPKIRTALEEHFAEPTQRVARNKWRLDVGDRVEIDKIDAGQLAASLNPEQDVDPVEGVVGGAKEGMRRLRGFIESALPRYADERNEIGVSVSSGLSPYLHFGQIAGLRAALEVGKADVQEQCADAFLEQLVVRRELAINFCLHNHAYDQVASAPEWARASLEKHRADERPVVYSLEELEGAQTHDELWNAAQTELVKSGAIHPYMRMVWAKNMLAWSPTPEDALARAIYLNDKYALDGRDPNGYANIAWCILGKHDRPFRERPVFGKVRYMSSEATKRKTSWKQYVSRVEGL